MISDHPLNLKAFMNCEHLWTTCFLCVAFLFTLFPAWILLAWEAPQQSQNGQLLQRSKYRVFSQEPRFWLSHVTNICQNYTPVRSLVWKPAWNFCLILAISVLLIPSQKWGPKSPSVTYGGGAWTKLFLAHNFDAGHVPQVCTRWYQEIRIAWCCICCILKPSTWQRYEFPDTTSYLNNPPPPPPPFVSYRWTTDDTRVKQYQHMRLIKNGHLTNEWQVEHFRALYESQQVI